MSGRLANLEVGSLKTNRTRRAPTTQLPSLILQAEQATQSQALSNIPEVQILQQIPGIQPFLIRDLIPDLIYLLQYEGSKLLIEALPKREDGKLSSNTPITPEELLSVFQNQGWERFLSVLATQINAPVSDIVNNIYTRGIRRLSILVAQADPKNPNSIIFRHPSQEIHIKTQEIELEIIRNEPEVAERDDLQCACGQRRIRTVTVQTRGGDEAGTVFAECVVCKRKWKFSSA